MMTSTVPVMVGALQSKKIGTKEAQETQKKSENQEEKKEIQETKEEQENIGDPETLGTQETQETLIIMNQAQDHINRGRGHQEMNQEENTGKNTETLLEIVVKIEEEQIEAAAGTEEEIGILIETTVQAMVGGDAEEVARSPWVMTGLL